MAAYEVKNDSPIEIGEKFVEQYFPEIAFTVSSVALLFFSPLAFTFGSAATFAMNYYMDPEMKIGAKDKIVTIPNTVFAIIGTITALVSLTPAGATGGAAFKATLLFGPYAMGTTAYRFYRSAQ